MKVGGAYTVLKVFTCCLVILGISWPNTSFAKTRVEINIFHPGAAYNIGSLTSFEQSLGINFTSAKWYQDWATSFDPDVANRFNSAGLIPELTWEPSENTVGVSYQAVISGNYDSYIVQTASSIKSLGYTIRVSLAPEMNTDWTPWGIGKQGNNADNHKLFWQHVVQKFRDAGANNVQWIWSPNVRPWNAASLYGNYANMYPGSSYVDYMGLDGYNWGTSHSWSVWQTFREVFESSYNELIGVSGKDILIMEMASSEVGGDKAAWITDMYKTLENSFPRIKGFTWFNINKETDWRINSSESAKAAFIAGYHGTTPPPASTTTTDTTNSSPSTTKKRISQSNSGATDQSQSAESSTTVAEPETPATPAESSVISRPVEEKLAGSFVAGRSFINIKNMTLDKIAIVLAVLANCLVLAFIFARRIRHLLEKSHPLWAGLGLVDSVFTSIQLRNRQTLFYKKIRNHSE